MVDEGLEEGGHRHVAAGDCPSEGSFYPPTFISEVDPACRLMQEEIFGPVLCVVRAESEEQAMQLINDHEYGNGTCIFTRDGEAARYFADETEAKVVIVSGAGRAFSAGADLNGFGGKQDKSTHEIAEIGRRMAESLESMRALAIARIQGWCVGGGLVLAAACDLRIASVEAKFSIPEVDLGIPLAWGEIPRLVR